MIENTPDNCEFLVDAIVDKMGMDEIIEWAKESLYADFMNNYFLFKEHADEHPELDFPNYSHSPSEK